MPFFLDSQALVSMTTIPVMVRRCRLNSRGIGALEEMGFTRAELLEIGARAFLIAEPPPLGRGGEPSHLPPVCGGGEGGGFVPSCYPGASQWPFQPQHPPPVADCPGP